MKKFKIHFVSISIIVLMLLLGLSTSYGVRTRLQIKNDSSKNIIIKITINNLVGLYTEDGNTLGKYDEENNIWVDYSEELFINRDETAQLRMLRSLNRWPEASELIGNIIIYNEDKEILKELIRENSTGDFAFFVNDLQIRGSRHNRIFTFTITDKLLE